MFSKFFGAGGRSDWQTMQVDDGREPLFIMVASETLPYTMNLHTIAETYPEEPIEYEPEQFPGLIWKLTAGTCLLFTSGSIVITGPNSVETIEKTIAELRQKIDKLFM